MDSDSDMIVSLSFSSYSTNGLASIAVKITNEFNAAADDDDFEFSLVLDDQCQIYHGDFLDRKMEEKDDFSIKMPLKTLFGYDSSSSPEEEADELELPTISETTSSSYCCLWRKKNNNNGERRRHHKSKKWNNKLFDLLRRSNSGGVGEGLLNSDDRKMKAAPPKFIGSPLEAFYVRSKAESEGSKRKSYLPYRQQLVGLFATTTAKRNGN